MVPQLSWNFFTQVVTSRNSYKLSIFIKSSVQCVLLFCARQWTGLSKILQNQIWVFKLFFPAQCNHSIAQSLTEKPPTQLSGLKKPTYSRQAKIRNDNPLSSLICAWQQYKDLFIPPFWYPTQEIPLKYHNPMTGENLVTRNPKTLTPV